MFFVKFCKPLPSGRSPLPPSGARLRAPPPPGAPCGLYYVFQWFLRNPVGAPARPAERRGPRQAPSRAAVAAGKSVYWINRFIQYTRFCKHFLWFLLPPGGAAGLPRAAGAQRGFCRIYWYVHSFSRPALGGAGARSCGHENRNGTSLTSRIPLIFRFARFSD